MDTATRTKAAARCDRLGRRMTPNEARKKYFGLGTIPGGDAAYIASQQYYSLEALAAPRCRRSVREARPADAGAPRPTTSRTRITTDDEIAASIGAL